MELIARLNREQGLTIVMVTHEAAMAAYSRRRIHFLDGRIEAEAGSDLDAGASIGYRRQAGS
jgi:putative ABC transport system ATP-binding protein